MLNSNQLHQPANRRSFFKGALALMLGGLAYLVPAASGFFVLLDPLRRRAAASLAVQVTSLDALPADNVPRRFPVIAARTDAWTQYDQVPVGAVYLRRVDEKRVEALNVVCPHAGCAVEYSAEGGQFRCPCHKSTFALDGNIADPKSPSPRGLDSLAVQVHDDGSVWVVFQNFQAGRPDKVPVA